MTQYQRPSNMDLDPSIEASSRVADEILSLSDTPSDKELSVALFAGGVATGETGWSCEPLPPSAYYPPASEESFAAGGDG